MRKAIVGDPDTEATANAEWLNLEQLARVEVSSEDELFPIEHALSLRTSTGWRAAVPGPQVIRLIFDHPQAIQRVQVHIVERAAERMQEIALFAETGGQMRPLMRQQFNFSPHGSTEEIEDFHFGLVGVTRLELRIDPDRSHDPRQRTSFATLMALRVG